MSEVEETTVAEEVTTQCDPSIEDCSLFHRPTNYPLEPSGNLMVFAFVSLINSVAISIWYRVSYDFQGNYNRRRGNNSNSNLQVGSPNVTQRNGNRGSGSDDDPVRRRGTRDDNAWRGLSRAHSSLWGWSTFFFVLYWLDWLKDWYAMYIYYVISNLNYVVYIGGMIALADDAAEADDMQGWLELTVYALLFAGGAWFMETVTGASAIRHLDHEHPYDDSILMPSIFYWLGLLEHTKRLTVVEIEES